jgi:hypothetical protein
LVARALEGQAVELPADCRRWQASGVQPRDRLDVALVKTDTALTQANLRVRRCAAWHDTTFGQP